MVYQKSSWYRLAISAIATTAPGRRRFTDDELLDAALRVFDEHGYQHAQVSDLATAAGTTKPTLYARLGGKEEIYMRVLEREADLLEQTLHAAYDEAAALPLREMVELSMLAFFRYGTRRRAGFRLLFGGEPGGDARGVGRRGLNGAITHITLLVEERLAAVGVPPGRSATLLAAASVGVALQICEQALAADDNLEAAGQLAAAYADAAFRGIDREVVRQVDTTLGAG